MEFALSRWFSTRSDTTCFAVAKAASVASLLPNISAKDTFPVGQSSNSRGASGFTASSGVSTAGSTS